MQCIAITRSVSRSIQRCELEHLPRQAIDFSLAKRQHRNYEETLGQLGLCLLRLPELPHLPDSVFVEDTALLFDELAVITRPGARSRRPETESMEQVLSHFRRLFYIQPPAVLDGGDVLLIGKSVYVGLSTRSNKAAIAQLQGIVAPFGYTVQGVPFSGCLHLKTAATLITDNTLLVNPDWVDPSLFPVDHITVDQSEPFAANALWLGKRVIYPSSCPKTLGKIENTAISIHTVDLSELAKAEGAVTCCSLIFRLE